MQTGEQRLGDGASLGGTNPQLAASALEQKGDEDVAHGRSVGFRVSGSARLTCAAALPAGGGDDELVIADGDVGG